ncbi:MAG TPA: hypothetical protein PLD58_01040 [Phycisphaerae bacterium]|nr:hypothetical protein [Phycisphaerae bacterium]
MRERIAGCILVVMLSAGAIVSQPNAGAEAPPAAPVSNGGFEAGRADGLPTGWHGPARSFARDESIARGASSSLRYRNGDAARYELCTQRLALQAGAKYEFSAWIKTDNIRGGDAGGGAAICMEWSGKDGKWMGGHYPSGLTGTKDWTRVVGVVRVPREAASFTITCYGRPKTTGTAWFDDVEVRRVFDPPLDSFVAAPNYRGWLRADDPAEVRIRARLNLLDVQSGAEELKLEAALRDASGRVLARADARPKGESHELTLTVAELAPGGYQAEIRLLDGRGRELGRNLHELRRPEKAFGPRVTIDRHGRTIVEGKCFLPLGMYFSSINEKDLRLLASGKFNCVMPYGSPNREQMDMAQRLGMKVIYSVKDLYVGSTHCPRHVKTTADEERAVRDRLKEFRDHPALLAWYLNDELPQSFMDRLEAHQKWAVQDDPNHPTWVVLYQVDELADYVRTFDVIGTDPYPIGRHAPSMAGQWARQTVGTFAGARPAWMVPQVFNWGNYEKGDKSRLRSPSYEEMRSMAWQCLCEGATGLIFYSFYDLRRNVDVSFDEQWGRLTRVVSEIDSLADVLLSIEPTGEVRAEAVPGGKSWLHWTARRRGGRLFLFCVNNGDGEGEVAVTLPRPAGQVRLRGGGAGPAVKGRSFRDRLGKLEVKVYEVEEK